MKRFGIYPGNKLLLKKLTILSALLFLILPFVRGEKKNKVALPENYRKWLEEEVVYIVTPREKNVFLKLQTDRERNIFIDAFWKQRDPTPGTSQNEFKEEHYRRLNYASEFFGRSTPAPGWKTDRGRIYIILGEPRNIETYDSVMGVYPVEIWFYLGDPAYGLPTAFRVIFFKKEGTGDYVLYSPSDHGPQSLIADYLGNAKDVVDAYQQLSKLEPNLARQTLTLIPSERVLPGVITLASNNLLSNIGYYPQKKVEDKYAEAILKYKDIIEVDYTANYIASDSLARVIRDDSGLFFVHYTVEPKKLSVGSYEGKFSANFELNGRISDSQERTVFQFTKTFPLSFSSAELNDVGAKSLALQDMFPLVPGTYRFDLLVKNTISNEFASAENEITIPRNPLALVMSPLVLGYGLEKSPRSSEEMIPFKIGSSQILCPARSVFTVKDTLIIFFQIFGLKEEAALSAKLRLTYLRNDAEFLTREKRLSEFNAEKRFIEETSLEKFPPGFYQVQVSLLDDTRREILVEKSNFEVTSAVDMPRPLVISKVMPVSRMEEYWYSLGLQWLNLGNAQEAAAFFRKAYEKNSGELKYALGLGQSLFMAGDYGKTKEILLPFAADLNLKGSEEVLYLLGKSCLALGQYAEAISYYQAYLSHFGQNLEVLNMLGMGYYRLGKMQEALQIWQKSLAVNPNQEEIKKFIRSIQEKKD